MSRLTEILPAQMNHAQLALYDDISDETGALAESFQTRLPSGALDGPWNIWLHETEVGSAIWKTSKALMHFRHLEPSVREIVILTVASHFKSAFEIYAHKATAQKHGLEKPMIASLIVTKSANQLTDGQQIARKVALALVAGGRLDEALYNDGLKEFGKEAFFEIVYLVGHYSFLAIAMNAFDVRPPPPETLLPAKLRDSGTHP